MLGGFVAVESVEAAPKLRVQVDQPGDFVLFGNTLAHDCASGVPDPVVGIVGSCGSSLSDSSPDIFWRSDEPAVGQATASTGVSAAQARSSAMLQLPAGAEITHAFLYWSARRGSSGADSTATLARPGVFSQGVTALESFTSSGDTYSSVADVTALVQASGAGVYRVSGVDTVDLINESISVAFSAWWMVVLYKQPAAPLRNLALFDGLDPVSDGNGQNAVLSGFKVPIAGFTARLGVVALEGDETSSGDQFRFEGTALSNGQNPTNNFFNGTRSDLGAPLSVAGDLPQLTGAPASMSGLDLDVVDVTALVSGGQTSASIEATSSGDQYYLAAFITSISTFKPDFSGALKTVVDLNGGAVLPGDTLEYTLVATNTGNDVSVGTVLTDALPAGVTFVPGSIQIVQGANAGSKTDASGDDQGSYDAASRTVSVFLGAGATGGRRRRGGRR
jgi:clumping factor A